MKQLKLTTTILFLVLVAGLGAVPRILETDVSVHGLDSDSTLKLSAISTGKRISFVDLNQVTEQFRIQVIVPDELPLIVLATRVHCVPIFLGDENSYMDYNGVPYIRTDSVASAIGCKFTPSKKNGGKLDCKSLLPLDSIGTEVGDLAPGFCLPDADGTIVRSLELLSEGKAVVAFIRSADWEPLSRDLLTRLDANRDNLTNMGTQAVVIHGYSPDVASGWRDSLAVEIPILSDDVSAVMRAYGVHQKAQLPHSSVFVLDRDGIIRFKHVYGAEQKPPEMLPILEAVRAIN